MTTFLLEQIKISGLKLELGRHFEEYKKVKTYTLFKEVFALLTSTVYTDRCQSKIVNEKYQRNRLLMVITMTVQRRRE